MCRYTARTSPSRGHMLTRTAAVAFLLLSLVAVNRSEAQTSTDGRQRPARGRDGQPGRVPRDHGRLLRADGRTWSNPQSSDGAVLQDSAGPGRHVSLVRHLDPDLHARPEGRAAVLDPLHRHDRHDGDGRQRPDAAAPHSFFFTTPTVKLLATNWYRRSNRFDAPIVIGLRFNQPVRAADLLQRLTLAYKPHDWTPPVMSPAARGRLQPTDATGLAAFDAKVAAAAAAASATTRLTSRRPRPGMSPARQA